MSLFCLGALYFYKSEGLLETGRFEAMKAQGSILQNLFWLIVWHRKSRIKLHH